MKDNDAMMLLRKCFYYYEKLDLLSLHIFPTFKLLHVHPLSYLKHREIKSQTTELWQKFYFHSAHQSSVMLCITKKYNFSDGLKVQFYEQKLLHGIGIFVLIYQLLELFLTLPVSSTQEQLVSSVARTKQSKTESELNTIVLCTS